MIDLGMGDAEFRAGQWERSWHHAKAALPHPWLPVWREIDALLHAVDPHHPHLQLFYQGRLQDDACYVDDGIPSGATRRGLARERLYGYLASGATVVFNGVENFLPLAARLCQDLGERMRCPATSNAYLSLASGGPATFGPHWDTHDVFVVQLLGRKRWRVFEPTHPLPLAMQTSQRSGHRRPDAAVLDCVLEPGDLLYVPRGWWHEVDALDEASFHVSVGIYPSSVFDYVQWVVARCLPEMLAARKRLNAPETITDLRAALDALAAAALAPEHVAEFMREISGRRLSPSAFDLELLASKTSLGDDVEVQLAPGVVHRSDAGDIAVDGRLQLDANGRAVVSVLAREGATTIGALCNRLRPRSSEAVRAMVLRLAFRDAVLLHRLANAAGSRGFAAAPVL